MYKQKLSSNLYLTFNPTDTQGHTVEFHMKRQLAQKFYFPFDHGPPLYTVQYFIVPILSLAISYDLMAWHCLVLLTLTPITEMGYYIGYQPGLESHPLCLSLMCVDLKLSCWAYSELYTYS